MVIPSTAASASSSVLLCPVLLSDAACRVCPVRVVGNHVVPSQMFFAAGGDLEPRAAQTCPDLTQLRFVKVTIQTGVR